MDKLRCVWITEKEADKSNLLIQNLWRMAPEDALEVATKAAKPWRTEVMGDGQTSAFYLKDEEIAANVLAALGMDIRG